MNTQLLLCVVIVLVFFIIMFNLCAPKETFLSNTNMKEYPEPLMQEHRKFIYNKSNKEMIIASIINEISKSLFNACFNDSSFTAIRTNLDILKNQMRIKLFRMVYGYMKNYIEKNGVVDTPRFEILKTYLLYLNYILASNSTENIKTEAQINNLITLGTTDSDNELKRRFDEIKIKMIIQ